MDNEACIVINLICPTATSPHTQLVLHTNGSACTLKLFMAKYFKLESELCSIQIVTPEGALFSCIYSY